MLQLSQIEESIQYLEGPKSAWKDHDRNLGSIWKVNVSPEGPQDSYHGPSRYYLVLNRVLYL